MRRRDLVRVALGLAVSWLVTQGRISLPHRLHGFGMRGDWIVGWAGIASRDVGAGLKPAPTGRGGVPAIPKSWLYCIDRLVARRAANFPMDSEV